MFKKSIFTIAIIILAAPMFVSAAWFWSKPAAAPTQTPVVEINSAEKDMADAKYKLWDEGVEKKNIESVMKNKDNFWVTTKELNYLFDKESSKAKTPLLSNLKLTNDNNQLKVTANFKKFISGHFSFDLQFINSENKIRLQLSKVKVYGIPVPSYWVSNPLNKELDKYLAFLYNDSRYQGFDFSNQNNILKLNLKFN